MNGSRPYFSVFQMAEFPDYRNFQIDFCFGKYLITGRYLTYIKYILDTETGRATRIDLRFYINRANYVDCNNVTPDECFNTIRTLCDKYEKNLTLELRQDFIADCIIPGISNPLPKIVSLPPSPTSESDAPSVLVKKKASQMKSQTPHTLS